MTGKANLNSRWAILTGEYPPQPGGVADYTRLVALGLAAAGDVVTVFAPPLTGPGEIENPGVTVVRLPDHFGPRGLAEMEGQLAKFRPDRVLVQYVPHAYGWKAMNLPFAVWVACRASRFAPVWVMFHEVVFHFRWRPLSHALLGAVTWLMARLVAGSAARAFGSISSWEERVRGICPRATPVEWLPVPSNIPAGEGIEAVRSASGTVIGHFGTYNPLITPPLERALVSLLQNRELSAVLLGRGGEDFRDRLVKQHPAFGGRVVAFGGLEATELAARLKGCDVLIQPYADGISCRRGSAMAGLASGVPVVSNLGALSENLWTTFGPIGLAGTPDAGELAVAAERVLALPAAERAAMGRHAAKLYRDRFGIENTIARLRSAGGGAST